MLNCIVCRYEHFNLPWFQALAQQLQPTGWRVHRKLWEYCVLIRALEERGMLRLGRTGIGFAVGKEPLASFFAGCGATITATDLAPTGGINNFETANQHAAELDDCYHSRFLDRADFQTRVHFRPADMRDLSSFDPEVADFVWSSCAMEHLGSLQAGIDFVQEATRLLKPGGVSVHTTEYNIGSMSNTIERGQNVIYRRRDLEELGVALRHKRCFLAPLELEPGTHNFDLDYDEAPYSKPADRHHITLKFNGHICTSALLIVQKGL